LKRLIDILASAFGLLIFSPLLIITAFLVWLYDFSSPFYMAPRVGRYGRPFRMVKLRSMVKNADKVGAASTSNTDMRITPVGKFIRRYKLDELCQLYNVLVGDMSLVGPRPTLQWEVDSYTDEEKLLLTVRPGITNLASIVFSDEGEILKGSTDPDGDYLKWIRPGKSQLALVTIKNASVILDIRIIFLTVIAIISKPKALLVIQEILKSLNVDSALCELASRRQSLGAAAPIIV
jgi:lipopolysaccharide/colanic/teichoic acid biosynthesis glycosyltransferase